MYLLQRRKYERVVLQPGNGWMRRTKRLKAKPQPLSGQDSHEYWGDGNYNVEKSALRMRSVRQNLYEQQKVQQLRIPSNVHIGKSHSRDLNRSVEFIRTYDWAQSLKIISLTVWCTIADSATR